MGLNHTAAMIENVCFCAPKLVLKHFNSRLGVRNLLYMANMAAAQIRPILKHGFTKENVHKFIHDLSKSLIPNLKAFQYNVIHQILE